MAAHKILVLGGTGFVGRAFATHWLRTCGPGARLLVPSRRPSTRTARALALLPGVELIEADVHDPAALARLVDGCDAVVNLVAILHGRPAAFQRVHVDLPSRLAAACRHAGVPLLVHVSALGVDDRDPEALPSHYLRSKARGERALREGLAGGTTALAILRPSVIFGAEDRFINLFATLQRFAPVMALAGASARFQPVWVGDVAEALVRVVAGRTSPLPAPTAHQPLVIECAGPRVWTLGELVHAAGAWSGHPRPVVPLPAWMGVVQAGLLGLLPGEPLMSADNLRSMRVPNVATVGRPGLVDLGLQPAELAAVMGPHLQAGR